MAGVDQRWRLQILLRADVIGPRGSEGTCLGTAQLAGKGIAQAAMTHGDLPEGTENNLYE